MNYVVALFTVVGFGLVIRMGVELFGHIYFKCHVKKFLRDADKTTTLDLEEIFKDSERGKN